MQCNGLFFRQVCLPAYTLSPAFQFYSRLTEELVARWVQAVRVADGYRWALAGEKRWRWSACGGWVVGYLGLSVFFTDHVQEKVYRDPNMQSVGPDMSDTEC